MQGQLLYALRLQAHQEDSDRNKAFLPGDLEATELISEELYGSMSFLLWGRRGWRRLGLGEAAFIKTSLRGEPTVSKSYFDN